MSHVPQRLRWFGSLLALRRTDRVLEIGCGGGHLLALLAERHPGVTLLGIDRSARQVQLATQRLRAAPAQPPVLHLALEDATAHFAGVRFSRIVAMNVNRFWTHPAAAGHAVRALLAPRGVVLLGFEPPTPRGRGALQAKLAQAAGFAGFRSLATHHDHASSTFAVAWSALPRRV